MCPSGSITSKNGRGTDQLVRRFIPRWRVSCASVSKRETTIISIVYDYVLLWIVGCLRLTGHKEGGAMVTFLLGTMGKVNRPFMVCNCEVHPVSLFETDRTVGGWWQWKSGRCGCVVRLLWRPSTAGYRRFSSVRAVGALVCASRNAHVHRLWLSV
jgi:hypothetical protein